MVNLGSVYSNFGTLSPLVWFTQTDESSKAQIITLIIHFVPICHGSLGCHVPVSDHQQQIIIFVQ